MYIFKTVFFKHHLNFKSCGRWRKYAFLILYYICVLIDRLCVIQSAESLAQTNATNTCDNLPRGNFIARKTMPSFASKNRDAQTAAIIMLKNISAENCRSEFIFSARNSRRCDHRTLQSLALRLDLVAELEKHSYPRGCLPLESLML